MYEYWQLLAVALEVDDLEEYSLAHSVYVGVNDPKQLKKWRARIGKTTGKAMGQENITDMLVGMAGSIPEGQSDPNKIIDFAHSTGRRILYLSVDGYLFSEQGQMVNDRLSTDLIIPMRDDSGIPN